MSGFANVGSNLIDNDQSVRELIARVHDVADGEDAQKLAQKQNEAYWKNKVRPASEGGKNSWDSLTADEQEKLRNAGPYSTVGMKRANRERDVISADETMRSALGIEQGGRLAGMYQQEQGKTGGLRVAGDVVSAVGGMTPNMAASAVGGPTAGFAALYASAAGASAQEARDNGADTLTAGLAGALRGGVEIATEKMFDGVPGLRGEQYASISNAVDGAVNRIFKTATGRRLANRAVNMAGEGLEEYVSDVAGGYISQLYQEDDRSFAQRLADPDAWYSFLIGSLMSAAMSGPVDAVNDSLAQRTGKSVQAQQMTDAVLEVAERQGGEAAELAGTMRQQQAAGKKFTPTDLGYLFNALDENGQAEIMDRVVNQDTISEKENRQAAEGLPSSAAAAAPLPLWPTATSPVPGESVPSREGSGVLRRIAAQRNMVAGGMTVDEAEQAYNARQAAQKNVGEVQKIAGSGIYNDAMNAALVENYRGGSVDTYMQAMSGLYNAGRTGSLTFEQGVRAVAPAAAVVNNETALRAAYEAGRSTVTEAEPMAAPGVSGNPAITMRGTTPESTSTPLQALQLAAMKLGTNVTIAGELDDGNGNAVNGSYNAANNEISLSEKSVNSYQTALHETAHYIQQNNPEGWAEVKRTALAFYTEKVGMTEAQDKVFKAYENAYGTDTGLYDEVAADLLSGIMSTDDGVKQYCDYILTADQYTTPQKRTILQTLRDAIGQLIESIKNVLRGGDATLGAAEGRKLAERAENLQEAAGIVDEFLDALDTAKNNAREIGKQKNVQVEQKKTARAEGPDGKLYSISPDTGNGDTVFAVNGDSYSLNKTKVNDAAEGHTAAEQQRMEAYKNAVDPDLVEFIQEARQHPDARWMNYQLGKVSSQTADQVQELTGVDVHGYTHNMQNSTVQHIDKRHGADGAADHSMAVDADIARVGWVLENYDILDKGTPSKQYKNKDGSRAATVVYKKAVDGTMYVVEAVPDSKARKMQIVTAYMTNKKTAAYHQPDTTNRPKATAKTDGEFTTVNTNIARQDGKVKFSMDVPVEETKDLVAVHNVDERALERSLELGVPVIEYAANDEDARLRALNSVENVKFSKKKQTAAEQIVSEATEKERLKKQLMAAETEKRELARKYTKARESADYWRQETQLSGGHLMDKKAVQKTAGEFIDKYGSRYGKSQLAGELERAFSKISRDGASTEEALETLTNIARGVLKESTVKDTTLRDYYAPVRDWLKNTTFEIRKNSPEYGDLMSEYGDGADGTHSWANVRKNTFGRVNLKLVGEDVTGNLDTAMMEMADNWPTIFDAEAAPVDNIRNALGVYEASQVQYHDTYGNDLDTAAALAGQELMDAYLATPTRETRADKAAAQLSQTRTALRAEQKAALAAQKAAYEVRVKALESDQSAQKAKLRAKWIETTRKAAQANNAKVAERLHRQAEGYETQLMRMDTPDYKKMQKQLLNQRAAFETLNERRKDTILLDRARDSVQKNVKQLYKWLAKPNEAGHVQTKMEKAVYDLLGKIDPSTSARGTKSDIRWQETMKDIQLMAQQSLDAGKGLTDADDYADFYPDLPNMIEALVKDAGDLDLHKLNGRQTQQLADILTSMKTSILNANKMMADGRGKAVQTVAENSILDMQTVKKSQLKNRNALLGKAADTWAGDVAAQLLGLDMMDARRYFSSLGSTAENDVYKPIRDGFDKRVWKLDAAQEKFAEIKGDADISKWTGEKAERQTFKLDDGNEIALTVGQRMEIYNLTQRQQAHEHLVKGGISIKEGSKKKKRVRLTPGDLADITSSLTNEQVKMARKMAAYLSATDGPAGWGNEVTQKLYGLNKYTESYYWPIKADDNYTPTSDATAGDTPGLYAIKNQGFTKATQREADNPVIMNDAFDTWCDHVANMATYNAWAIPLSDAMKWYNYRSENKISTKAAIEGVYGAKGKKFFLTLMQDINGVSAAPSQTGDVRFAKTMVRNWKVAKVGANLRVAIQQPTAYTRAAAVISPKYLTAALAYDVGRLKQGKKRAESNCAIAKWKSWGYFETNIGQTMKSVLTGERDTLDKVREISTKLAERGDRDTWGTLWNACELEARDKGMKPGSQESLDYCAARLSEIVDKTQVVDSVLHRSQIMRSKDMLTQMATNFFAEPTKTYSMIAEAAVKLAHREEGARANMGRVLATYFVTAFGTAAAAGLIDAMRVGSDDKDKEFGERYLDALWDGFVDNINLLNNIPMVKDVISIFDGYDATRTDMEAATDMYNAVVAWQKFLTQDPNSKGTPYKLIYKTANAIADATGIPVGTAVREVKSAYDIVTALQDPLHVDETFTDTNAKLNSRLMRGQMDEAQEVLDKLVQNKIDGGKTAKEARSSIRSSLTIKWKPLYLAAEDAQRAEIASKLLALRVNGEVLYTQKDLSKWVEDAKKKEKK